MPLGPQGGFSPCSSQGTSPLYVVTLSSPWTKEKELEGWLKGLVGEA